MVKTATVTRTPKSVDEKYLGSEPPVGSILSGSLDILKALNYYNYFNGRKEAIQFLHKYFAKDNNRLKVIKKIDDNKIPTTLGWIARMLSRNCTLPQETLDFFETNITTLIDNYVEPVKAPKAESGVKFLPFIAELEDQIDDFIKNGYTSTFNFVEWQKANSIGPTATGQIVTYYRPIVDELEAIKTDKELKESYHHMKPRQRTALLAFISSFIVGSEAALENRRRERTPRKKRQPKIETLIKSFNFQASDNSLNISSISPAKIIGSTQLVTFNTKTRKLSIYVALPDQTFSIKGSTLLNFDEKKSVEKTVRKPHETIPLAVKATKRSIGKLLSQLSTTESNISTGRINKHHVLLMAYK